MSKPVTVTVPVSAGQYDRLIADIAPDSPTVTHKMAVGPFYLPGSWKVVSGQGSSLGWQTITLERIEEE